jgi:hypothetical protein
MRGKWGRQETFTRRRYTPVKKPTGYSDAWTDDGTVSGVLMAEKAEVIVQARSPAETVTHTLYLDADPKLKPKDLLLGATGTVYKYMGTMPQRTDRHYEVKLLDDTWLQTQLGKTV